MLPFQHKILSRYSSHHVTVFNCQLCILPPAYLYQKDEQAPPGNPRSSKLFCLCACSNERSGCQYTPFCLFSGFFVIFSWAALQLAGWATGLHPSRYISRSCSLGLLPSSCVYWSPVQSSYNVLSRCSVNEFCPFFLW
jgi:hypothetical protein